MSDPHQGDLAVATPRKRGRDLRQGDVAVATPPSRRRDLCQGGVAGCRVIHTFMPKVLDNFRFSSASNVGRGGMEAKVASAWDAAQAGVTTVIANGKQPSVLLRVRLPWSSPLVRAWEGSRIQTSGRTRKPI